MTTEWVITAAAERVDLRDGKGETTFTVTNPGPAQDRVVFEVVPGDGADGSWFPPPEEEQQRLVAGNGSEQFKVAIAVPAGAPAGSYWFQCRAYSADTAPEEGSRLSPRVAFEVKASVKAKKPWWPYAVAAGLVLVVLVVVGWLVFRDGEGPQTQPSPSQSPTPTLRVAVSGQVVRAAYTGSCPPPAAQAPTFRAVISVTSGPTIVSYQWLTSNGGSSDPSLRTVTFTQASYLPGKTFNDWIAVYVRQPVAVESNHMNFSVTCQ